MSSSFIGSVGKLVSASIASQAILLAILPLVTRLYNPADFGVFAVFVAILALVLVASSLRYELAIPLPRSDGNAFALLLLALLLNAIIALVSILIVLPWGRYVANALNSPELVSILWLLPFSILGAGTYRALRLWAVRHHDFNALASTSIMQAIANAVAQIGCGMAGLGGMGLALSHFFGQSAGAKRLTRGTASLFWGTGRRGIVRMRYMALRYNRFPKFDVAAALIDTLSMQLPNLLLAGLFSPLVAGHYLLAERILGTPLSLISQAVGQVIYARSRTSIEAGTMAPLAVRVLFGLGVLIVVPATLIFFVCEPLFAFVFGESWRAAGLFASWIVIGHSAQFLFSSISLVLMATNAQNINLVLHLGMLVAKSASLYYGYMVGSALSGIIAFSFVNLFGYMAAIVVVIWHARSYVPLAVSKRQTI